MFQIRNKQIGIDINICSVTFVPDFFEETTVPVKMAASIAGVFSDDLKNAIESCKVLVVGAGGIGCEILKNLVLSGFKDIEIVSYLHVSHGQASIPPPDAFSDVSCPFFTPFI